MKESEQSLHESLSAAIDGEAEELELRRVLNAVTEDPELQAKWERLHALGSLLRREPLSGVGSPPAWPTDAVTDAAPAAAEAKLPASQGAASSAARRFSARRWLAPLGSAVLAAAAGLVVALYFAPGEQPEAPAIAGRAQPAHGLGNVPTAVDLERANAYIYQHARGTSIAARPAAMPFVKELSTATIATVATVESTEMDTAAVRATDRTGR